MNAETAYNNEIWSRLLVEELLRSGVDQFCLSPGSRNTPLLAAIGRADVRRTIHYDERGSAFFALGYARATGRPAVWVTTSGTAVANGLPAVVEASQDGVPLLLLTADRPPELRDTGANQAIIQPGIFGPYVRWQFDLPAPGPSMPHEMVLTTVDQAVYRACRAPQGPVHLNCMFREPFLTGETPRVEHPRPAGQPFTTYALPVVEPAEDDMLEIAGLVEGARHGVLVAGRLRTRAEALAVAALAEHLGWPLLPDVLSQLRLGADMGQARIAFASRITPPGPPDVVLHIGGRITARPLNKLAAGPNLRALVHVSPDPWRLDPSHRVSFRLESDVEAFCRRLTTHTRSAGGSWLNAWQAADRSFGQRWQEWTAGSKEISEPLVAWLVSSEIPDGTGLMLAASMPVRDMDSFARPDGAWVPIVANRGASGIDGTIATAAGFAHGLKAPVTLVIGDLAALHDLNSLALLKQSAAPVIVVIINNDGGGIFSFLPVAAQEDLFEPYFGTPHGMKFDRAAEMFDLPYARPDTTEAFVTTYRAALERGASCIIEVVTDRRENLALHQMLSGGL